MQAISKSIIGKFKSIIDSSLDVSDTGIGAVLSKVDDKGVEHVVAYASRILTKSERN